MFKLFQDMANAYTDPFLYAVWVIIVLLIIEYILSVKYHLDYYEKKDTLANLGMMLGASLIGFLGKPIAFFYFTWLHDKYSLFAMPTNSWWYWVVLMLGVDFTYYWYHRWSHEIRILWAAHVNHHSSQYFNYSVALRQAWVIAAMYYIFWVWLVIIGFTPVSVLFCMSILHIYQFWVHTESIGKLGFLEKIIVTPSFHRVHHGSNPKYIDKNHSGVFIIWDVLFGTFAVEDEKVIYGLTKNINTYNPIRIAFHEYKSIWDDIKKPGSLKNKLGYIFGNPGWEPKEVKEIKSETTVLQKELMVQ